MALPVTCACGRVIAYRNFKPHGRKCFDQLCVWAKGGKAMYLLDDRSEKAKKERPLPGQAAPEG